MLRFSLEKLAGLVAVLLAVSAVVYFLGRGVAPGDVSTVIIGTDGATRNRSKRCGATWDFDQPLYVAYAQWLGDAVRLRLGSSPISGLTVSSQLAQQLPVSLELALLAVLLSHPHWRPARRHRRSSRERRVGRGDPCFPA